MSNLELKGGILEMIANINDQESLKELKEIISEFIGNHLNDADSYDELSDDEKTKLEEAIEESEEFLNS